MDFKFIPMLMQTEMVEAYMQNTKNQTRRLRGLDFFNSDPDGYIYDGNDQPDQLEPLDKTYHWFEFVDFDGKPMEAYISVKCPYGKVGDVLWIRETFCGIVQADNSVNYIYKAELNSYFANSLNPFWKPSIHMPKKACRLFAKITNIRIERLKDISEADAIAEGIERADDSKSWKDYFYKDIGNCLLATTSYITLWQSINKDFDPITDNPWVWVVEFQPIEKPTNFI